MKTVRDTLLELLSNPDPRVTEILAWDAHVIGLVAIRDQATSTTASGARWHDTEVIVTGHSCCIRNLNEAIRSAVENMGMKEAGRRPN